MSRAGRARSRAPGIRRRVLLAAPSEKRVVRQVSWLPDPPPSGSFPNAQPVFRSLAFSGLPPEASPVTVAGAARDFHPLPLAEQTQRTEEQEPKRRALFRATSA